MLLYPGPCWISEGFSNTRESLDYDRLVTSISEQLVAVTGEEYWRDITIDKLRALWDDEDSD